MFNYMAYDGGVFYAATFGNGILRYDAAGSALSSLLPGERVGALEWNQGSLYYTSGSFSDSVRRLQPPLDLSSPEIVVGGGTADPGDGSRPTEMALSETWDLSFDAAGRTYLAEWGRGRVRRVSPAPGSERPVNGNFQNADLAAWSSVGDTRVVSYPVAFGPATNLSARISNTGSAVTTSSLSQSSRVPSSARWLAFRYDFQTNEGANSFFNDRFTAYAGDASLMVDTRSGLTSFNQFGFARHTGTRFAALSVAHLAGQTATVRFAVSDDKSATGDTAVVLDDVRFIRTPPLDLVALAPVPLNATAAAEGTIAVSLTARCDSPVSTQATFGANLYLVSSAQDGLTTAVFLGTATFPNAAAGTHTKSVMLPVPHGLRTGSYRVAVALDAGDIFWEYDESNNQATSTGSVSVEVPGPLVCISNETAHAGERKSVAVSLLNTGPLGVGTLQMDVRFRAGTSGLTFEDGQRGSSLGGGSVTFGLVATDTVRLVATGSAGQAFADGELAQLFFRVGAAATANTTLALTPLNAAASTPDALPVNVRTQVGTIVVRPPPPDDHPDTASATRSPEDEVFVGMGSGRGELGTSTDVDWFRVEVLGGVPYILTYSSVFDSLDVTFQAATIGYSSRGRVEFTPQSDGTQLFAISSSAGQVGAYFLTVEGTPPPDRFEQNDTVQAAATAPFGRLDKLTIDRTGDDDWYRLPAVAGGLLSLRASSTTSGVRPPAVQCFSLSGTELRFLGQAQAAADGSSVLVLENLPAAAEVLVQVSGYAGWYELTSGTSLPEEAQSWPDLQVASLVVTPSRPAANESLQIQATVSNLGGAQTGAFGWLLSVDGTIVATGYVHLGLLGAETGRELFSTTLPGYASGVHVFRLSLDPYGQVAEYVEENNSRDVAIQINSPPVAVAHATLASEQGGVAVLDGSASSDPDGDPLTYAWTQTAGLEVVLGNATSPVTTVVLAAAGTYEFQLAVVDPAGASATSTVQVTVAGNSPPLIDSVVASVGGPALVNEPVMLTGVATDPEGQTLATEWFADEPGPLVRLGRARVGARGESLTGFMPTTPATYWFTFLARDPAGATSSQRIAVTALLPAREEVPVNGDFRHELDYWSVLGTATTTSTTGGQVALVTNATTGCGALEQAMLLPASARYVDFAYDFLTNEAPNQSSYNDDFRVRINGEDVLPAPVDSYAGFEASAPGTGFARHTGWRRASVEVSRFAGRQIVLRFEVNDANDTTVDSGVALDDVILVTLVRPDVAAVSVNAAAATTRGTTLPLSFTLAASDANSTPVTFASELWLAPASTQQGQLRLGQVWTHGLAPGAVTTVSAAYRIPETLPIGQYRVVLVADSSGALDESDESNNRASSGPVLITEPVAGPTIQLSAAALDFGNVAVNGTRQLVLTVSNVGGQDLVLQTLLVDGARFSLANPPALPKTVEPGGETALTVVFSPAAVGAVAGALTIGSNGVNGTQTVAFSGTGTGAVLAVSASSVGFGDVRVGNSATRTFLVTNTGNVNLNVNTLASSSARFAVTTPTLPLTLAPRATRTVYVRYSPAALGASSGTLTFGSNALAPVPTVAVSGRGIGAVAVVSPASLTFGTVPVGTSAERSLTVSNSGNVALSVASCSSNNSRFVLVSALPVSVPAGGSQALTVRFTPLAAGPVSGALTLTSDALTPISAVSASGTGATTVLKPDLIAEAVLPGLSGVSLGATLPLTYQLRRDSQTTGNLTTTVLFYLSVDTALSPSSDLLVGNVLVSDIAPGSTRRATASFNLPGTIATGSYYLLMRISPGNEQNVENNVVASASTLTVRNPRLAVVVNPAAAGSVSAQPVSADGLYAPGTVVTLLATPAAGYEFNGWTGSVSDGTATTTTVMVQSDTTVTANFRTETCVLTLAVSPAGSGTVSRVPSSADGRYARGTVVFLQANSNTGFVFHNWSGGVTGTSPTATLTIEQSTTVTANFAPTESEGQFIHTISTGFNSVALAVDPTPAITKAIGLVDFFATAGAGVSRAVRWTGSAYQTFNRATPTFNNFTVRPVDGYFLKSSTNTSVAMEGPEAQVNSLTLSTGFNFVNGIAFKRMNLNTAREVVEYINREGGSVTRLLKWTGSAYVTFNLSFPTFNNFAIEKGRGYFAKSTSNAMV
ncbi:MAG: choice-of-anchor D domain-containing protein [Candidatus Riflebacteria bacterium]|nr:choice-of-anchor D domain-containing protein [Candidatus Riflebacteria bacterium]